MKIEHPVDLVPIERLLAEGRLEEAIEAPLGPARDRSARIQAALSRTGAEDRVDAAWTAGLTLGDLAYDLWRINPEIVEAVDFASADNVGGLLGFPVFADRVLSQHAVSIEGSINRIEGYVAEQIAAHRLQAMGHVVQFPDGPTQAGWDLLVDGESFQIKCLSDPSGVYEHFERYPDIPVIANEELSTELAAHDGVYFVPGFSHSGVRELTHSSFEAGQEALDFEIPWIALIVSGARNARGLVTGYIDPLSAVLNTGTDVAGAWAVGTAGSKVAAVAGGFLFGPAGIVVGGLVGAVLGSVQGRRLARRARGLLVRPEAELVRSATVELIRGGQAAADRKLVAFDEQGSSLVERLSARGPAAAPLKRAIERRVADGRSYLGGKIGELAQLAAEAQHMDVRELAARALRALVRAGIHPVRIQREYGQFFAAFEALDRKERALRLR